MKIHHIIFAVLFVVLCHAALAASSFQWLPVSGSLKDNQDPPVNIPVDGATMLTYISNNSVIDALSQISGGKITLLDTYGAGDDNFYRALTNERNGRYETVLMNEAGNGLIGKYAYAIVLNMPFSVFSTTYGGLIANVPKNGTIYAGVTPVIGGPIDSSEFSPQAFNGGAVVTNLQVIPEPAGVGLILLGAGMLAIRRYRMRG